ncbi:MAG: FtsW/RodA/SpoVE family cell cycle protein [Clostridiaceae bacterium]|nr:FtsW/RodA/SpoVE family cell cycle protein [Clostridiaceae bacterium]MDY5888634.1 FtsW/RodA/SpoVE family cell cycle protein [Oscillospiraceae bacterium]
MSGEKLNNKFHWGFALILVTIFQVLTGTVTITGNGFNSKLFVIYAGFIILEWGYFIIASTFFGQNNFEIEIIGFLFSGIGLTNVATVDDGYALKQIVAILLGLFVFIAMLVVLRRTDIVMKLRMPVAVAAVGLLVANLALAQYTNGALNWITIGGISVQPSEFVKLAFIFVGAASLDKLQNARSLTKYLIFSFGCVGALFLMKDFGTALIFFFTFIIIAFMRSGDVRTIAIVCVAALLGALMIVYFKPHVAARFRAYRHIWELINEEGMQQTRTLIYSASGGLFGLGIGKGELRNVVFASTDLAFGMICEEWGMIIAFTIVITYAFLLLYAIKVARNTRSAFYAIAACAAAGLILFQTSLNIFGVTDILPFTGVTLPFISRGGSSVISSWGMLAFIKSADIRTYPKLSKTILPDHPLYPDNIMIGKRPKRQVYIPPVVNKPVTAKKPAADIPVSKKKTTSSAKDIPVSKKRTASPQSSKDIPISRRKPPNGGTKR